MRFNKKKLLEAERGLLPLQLKSQFLQLLLIIGAFFCVIYGIPIQEIIGTAALIYFFITSDAFLASQVQRASQRIIPSEVRSNG